MLDFIKNMFSSEKEVIREKDWSNDWLAMNEKNMLAQGGVDLRNPMKASYLVYKSVQIISQNTPQAPLMFLQDENPVPQTHPLNLLFNNPNEFMTYFDLISSTAMYFALYGEAHWYLNKSNRQLQSGVGIPGEILMLDPRAMVPTLTTDNILTGWTYDGTEKLNLDEVLTFKNSNSSNIWRGASPLDSVQVDLRSDIQAGNYQEKFFEQGAIPGFVLEVDKDDSSTPSELRKLGRMWDKRHQGSKNASKTAVLRGGMKVNTIGLTQREMSYLDTRKFTRDIILSVFGVPKILAGFTDGEVNRSVADVHKRIFWQETIKPILLRVQDKINSKILADSNYSGLTAMFDFTKIQELNNEYKDDIESSWNLFQMGFSRNEINSRFNLGFNVDDDTGDLKYVPLNLAIAGEPYGDIYDEDPDNDNDDDNKPEDDNDSDDVVDDDSDDVDDEKIIHLDKAADKKESFRQRFLAVQAENEKAMLPKIRKYFLTQRKKVLTNMLGDESKSEADFDERTAVLLATIDIMDAENQRLVKVLSPYIAKTVEDGQKLALENIGIVDRDIILDKVVFESRMNKIVGINNTVYKQLRKTIMEGIEKGEAIGLIADRVRKVYNVTNSRATIIARTETASAINQASWIQYRLAGVKKKDWSTSKDERVRESHKVNGSQGAIPIGNAFSNGEMYPGQNSIACRCHIIPVVEV